MSPSDNKYSTLTKNCQSYMTEVCKYLTNTLHAFISILTIFEQKYWNTNKWLGPSTSAIRPIIRWWTYYKKEKYSQKKFGPHLYHSGCNKRPWCKPECFTKEKLTNSFWLFVCSSDLNRSFEKRLQNGDCYLVCEARFLQDNPKSVCLKFLKNL